LAENTAGSLTECREFAPFAVVVKYTKGAVSLRADVEVQANMGWRWKDILTGDVLKGSKMVMGPREVICIL
jgi:hypothetical protein